MKEEFLEEEIPFGTLARFGLTRDMIDDLPVGELRRIYGGEATSVLPIRVADESGNIIKSRTRFMLVRRADGDADVMFFPAMIFPPVTEPLEPDIVIVLSDATSEYITCPTFISPLA